MTARLPAGVTPTEARLQERLYEGGHPEPLAEAARCVRARQTPSDDSVLACVRCIPAQRGPQPAAVDAARAWLYRRTSQPNGQPWADDPEHLEQAARALAAAIGTEA